MAKIRLIVIAAYKADDEGNMVEAFEPRQMPTEDRAIREGKALSSQYDGVLAWARDADPDIGEYGPPTIIYQHGEIPDIG
ncbi:hypothetical protein [Agrobacterium bohemicum]|uniref:Uncharacterized protein n=1 Tax=Agrobacterium bohemicum TaxID=2052828 RepID=A0A135NXH8_9HYPH|nr:hypothetical protein [Agrobacterium bohemicum]KXG83860.1 hypothetical protein ATO67_15100 [Agrobacterium bohemicum]